MSSELFDLKGKVVLITGSSRGLGRTLAQGFAAAGARVVLNARDAVTLAAEHKALCAAGHDAHAFPFDITAEDSVADAVAAIESGVGPIDVLINNAGINRRAPLIEQAEADWQAVLDTNLTAAWRVARSVARGMLVRGQGKIVNIASLMSHGGRENTGAYTASKGGVALLTKAMAVEWGGRNVQCNAIAPGYFLSDMTAALAADPAFDAWVKMRAPAARWGDPRELLGAAIFLASSASSYVNGQILYVDGGWTAKL
jgi:gluconate 5-dehydrogenase